MLKYWENNETEEIGISETGTRSGPDSENIPYFREIWQNHTLF